MPKPIKDKYAIAAALQEIGTLLELKGGEYFKARAYKSGARSIAEVSEDLGRLIKENRLTFVKGIGFALAKQIEQLYTRDMLQHAFGDLDDVDIVEEERELQEGPGHSGMSAFIGLTARKPA